MRDSDGRKLDHKTLEQLRIRAVGQVEQGAHPDEVAAALGMTRAAVYSWLAKYRQGGLEALKARPVPGRPPRLGGSQLARLYTLVVSNDPRQLRFAFALWTRAMIRELIRREAAAQAGPVAPAAAEPGLPAESRGGGAVEGRGVSRDPRASGQGGGDDLLRR